MWRILGIEVLEAVELLAQGALGSCSARASGCLACWYGAADLVDCDRLVFGVLVERAMWT